jgi:hypothetical protein
MWEVLDGAGALLLQVGYDDGFAAFLNGIRVAESNAPLELSWNSASAGSHEADEEITFDLSAYLNLLSEGENLLAIHALNSSTTSSDFLLTVSLVAAEELNASISEHASMYEQAVSLDRSAHIVARTYLDGSWSAAAQGFVTFEEDFRDIKLTEIHYNPLPGSLHGSSDYEFMELKNTGLSTLNLEGMGFNEGIDFVFTGETGLGPGEFVVLASNENRFFERYGFLPDGEYSGNLNNGGELLRLDSPGQDTLFRLLYDNQAPWPVEADGTGYSLVPVELNPSGDQNGPQNWRASYHEGGSPGRDDTESTSVEDRTAMESDLYLGQNYPNPFDGTTYIRVTLPEKARMELAVYNLTGQQVATLAAGVFPEGTRVVSWNGTDGRGTPVEAGIYFYRLVVHTGSGTHIATRKMIRY